ncbi:arylsulfatase [Leptospira bourretii]|uniref:Arylsulfatase n=2 Tax=Leptospira bourretii TaxID=2484962 RepID=A0A4V3JLF7_9LEPT|nr:sulfatase-like hydrolase/transferase [Leptospira bourretii]TGK89468.1 arylsulfatase [Leptospira bourretii]TGK93363.1 arylsulfatase [Leptospira bourretii]TGL18296.1 arylsulfatase [Leptospira bourretii]
MTLLYLLLYFFQGPIILSFGVWIYFHGLCVTLLAVLSVSLDFYLNQNQKDKRLLKIMIRVFLWFLFLVVLGYQEVYQTALTFEIVFYFLNHINHLYSDIQNFFYQWQVWQWITLGMGFFVLFFKNRKIVTYILLFGLIFVLVLRFDSERKKTSSHLNTNTNQQISRGKNFLESISGRPNIVLVMLEGVGRKHLVKTKSNYIDFSVLQDSHFWIPMPHTSKSIFTWLTGDSQLQTTRLTFNDSLLQLNLPKQLENLYGYETFMIYTQSLYFEGMDLFFPQIFQTVRDKSYLEEKYGKLYPTFSWGMDDRVVLSAMKQMFGAEKKPLFVLIGLSQTHSPYFVTNENSQSQWDSPLIRYEASLREELAVIDSIISFWKDNSSRETVLILTADHGESFGEEGAHAHNYSLYNQETDVPFLLYFIKSGQIYVPKLGTSVDFKDTILHLLETNSGKIKNNLEADFFHPNYQPNLFLKTWNSEIQKSWVIKDKKYIYHSDRDQLIQMDWSEKKRVPVTDSSLKQKIKNQIYSGMY